MRTKNTDRRKQRGYTLLEYCAGAAIIASILWASLNNLGGSLSELMNGVGTWAKARTTMLSGGPGAGSN